MDSIMESRNRYQVSRIHSWRVDNRMNTFHNYISTGYMSHFSIGVNRPHQLQDEIEISVRPVISPNPKIWAGTICPRKPMYSLLRMTKFHCTKHSNRYHSLQCEKRFQMRAAFAACAVRAESLQTRHQGMQPESSSLRHRMPIRNDHRWWQLILQPGQFTPHKTRLRLSVEMPHRISMTFSNRCSGPFTETPFNLSLFPE
jgi:hypothetical protein